MITTLTYYKNSNTGELIKKQHFYEISFDAPDCFYNYKGKAIETHSLIGFVEISEKKFKKEAKNKLRSEKNSFNNGI
jgi:hypothetical protein